MIKITISGKKDKEIYEVPEYIALSIMNLISDYSADKKENLTKHKRSI